MGHAVGPRLQRQRGRQVVVSPAPLQLTSRGTTSRQLTASHTWAGRKGVRVVVWGAAVGGSEEKKCFGNVVDFYEGKSSSRIKKIVV